MGDAVVTDQCFKMLRKAYVRDYVLPPWRGLGKRDGCVFFVGVYGGVC